MNFSFFFISAIKCATTCAGLPETHNEDFQVHSVALKVDKLHSDKHIHLSVHLVKVLLSQYSLAVIQPDITSSQPGSMVLVLIGNKLVDQSRDSWFEGISILVGPVPKQYSSTTDINTVEVDSVSI